MSSAQEPDYAAEMRLPDGITCDVCSHAKRCFGMGFSSPGRTSCDFWPSRYRATSNQGSDMGDGVKLTKAGRACLTAALEGYVHPPMRGSYRLLGGEIGRVPGCFGRRTINALTEMGLLAPVDIETRRITPAGRAAISQGQEHG